jgi:GlpG protein
MRSVGSLPEPGSARRFSDYLVAVGIPNTVEPAGGGGWEVWIHDEEQIARAGEEYDRYRQDPSAARYEEARAMADSLRRMEESERALHEQRRVDVRRGWAQRQRRSAPATTLLIVVCVGVALLTRLGEGESALKGLLLYGRLPSMAELEEIQSRPGFEMPDPASYGSSPWRLMKTLFGIHGFELILSGQVWRLFTPMLLHFGLLHLLFNMFWLRDLGGQIEAVKGTGRFLALVLVSAGLSDTAQNWMSGPLFGGMSGVNYALFGYLWMKQRYQASEGLWLAPQTIPLMLGWLLLCMTGMMGPVANTAHVVGLLAGVAVGGWPTLLNRLRRRLS